MTSQHPQQHLLLLKGLKEASPLQNHIVGPTVTLLLPEEFRGKEYKVKYKVCINQPTIHPSTRVKFYLSSNTDANLRVYSADRFTANSLVQGTCLRSMTFCCYSECCV